MISRIMASISACDFFAHEQGHRQEAMVFGGSGVLDCTCLESSLSVESTSSETVVFKFCDELGCVTELVKKDTLFVEVVVGVVVVVVVVAVVVVVLACTTGSKKKVQNNVTVFPILMDALEEY